MKNKFILILTSLGVLAAVASIYVFKGDHGNALVEDHIQWVDPSKIQLGPIRSESLSNEQVASIKAIHQTLGKYDGQSLEKWVDDFKRDVNPDREIEIWQAIAKSMDDVKKRQGNNEAKIKEAYKIVLMSSMAPYEQAKEHMEVSDMEVSDMEEEEIIDIYKLFSMYYRPTAQPGNASPPGDL